MNQDNLNFGVWQSGRADSRDARATAAQLALEAQRQKQEELMFGKRSAYDTERDNRIEGRADARTASERAYQDKLYGERVKPMNDRTLAEYDAAAAERQRLRDEAEARRRFFRGGAKTLLDGKPDPGFMARLASGEISGDEALGELAANTGEQGEAMFPMLLARQDQTAQISADRILQDLQSNDPRRRARGLKAQETAPAPVKRMLGATPQTAQDMDAIDPTRLPEDVQNQLKRGVGDLAKGINESDNISGAWTGGKSSDIQEQIGQIRQRLQAMASANPGVPVSALWKRLRGELDTGGASWNIGRLFGAIDTNTQDANEVAIETLDKEFGAF